MKWGWPFCLKILKAMRILLLNTWKLRILCLVFTVLYDEDTSLDVTRSGIIAAWVAN